MFFFFPFNPANSLCYKNKLEEEEEKKKKI